MKLCLQTGCILLKGYYTDKSRRINLALSAQKRNKSSLVSASHSCASCQFYLKILLSSVLSNLVFLDSGYAMNVDYSNLAVGCRI